VFALAMVAVFGLAAAVGAGVGPLEVGVSSNHTSKSDPADHPAEMVEMSGLTVAAGGYRLVADAVAVDAGTASAFTFRIERSDGSALTEFDVLHERRLHLIVLSRDLVGYLHLHPTMDPDGRWRVELPPLQPGSYRVYADFEPHGADRITLAADLLVPGFVAPGDGPEPASSVDVDGYVVSLSGDAVVGASTLTFDVARNGSAVVTEPYLGAAGHLVVIRAGDLGYLHVHPLDSDSDGPVRFAAEFPTPGTYRLFFEFSVDGTVRMASFTVEVAPSSPASADPSTSEHDEGHSS
jgi:hypothetical protein